MGRDLIRVLLVEDDEDDYILTRDLLCAISEKPFHLEWIEDYAVARETMARNRHDVYLLDYRLNGDNGLDLLREAKANGCRGPIILLTGQGEHEVDVDAMKAGAADYLVKGRIDSALLERSIRYAVERHRDQRALRQAHDELEQRVQERTLALSRANEALQEADRRKDEFLAMLGHELRNPLAPILSGLHILQMPNASVTICGATILMMEQQVRNLARLVDDLLDVSRITRGKIQLRKETIELTAAVTHAVETVRPLIEAQKHDLTVSLPASEVFLNTDAIRLEQVLCNLLTNATKYTEPGGRIHLAVDREGDSLVLRLRDNGVGIHADDLPHVFDLFVQSERALDRSQGGLGIGLTLVRNLVEMMGGTATAFSDGPGKGSEFVVRLPALSETSPPKSEIPLKVIAPDHQPLRVLVAEDVTAVAETMIALLKLWGHEARAVHDGPATIDATRTYRPDVILLDIGLPGMNGYEVARQLQQEPENVRPLIVALTGYGQEEDRRRSREAGCDHHLVKPVDPNDLQAFLARANSHRQNLGTPGRR